MSLFSIARSVYRGLTRSQRRQLSLAPDNRMGDPVLRGDRYDWDNPRLTDSDIAKLTAKLGEFVDDSVTEAVEKTVAVATGPIPSADTILHMKKAELAAMAVEHGIDVVGTGVDGNILKEDLVNALIAAQ